MPWSVRLPIDHPFRTTDSRGRARDHFLQARKIKYRRLREMLKVDSEALHPPD